jgi:hypothetical protein
LEGYFYEFSVNMKNDAQATIIKQTKIKRILSSVRTMERLSVDVGFVILYTSEEEETAEKVFE